MSLHAFSLCNRQKGSPAVISWLLASLADSEIFCLTSHCGSDGSWSPLVCGCSYFAISLCYSLRCAALVFSLMPTELLSTFGFDVLVRCCISLLVIAALPWCDYGMGGGFDFSLTASLICMFTSLTSSQTVLSEALASFIPSTL